MDEVEFVVQNQGIDLISVNEERSVSIYPRARARTALERMTKGSHRTRINSFDKGLFFLII